MKIMSSNEQAKAWFERMKQRENQGCVAPSVARPKSRGMPAKTTATRQTKETLTNASANPSDDEPTIFLKVGKSSFRIDCEQIPHPIRKVPRIDSTFMFCLLVFALVCSILIACAFGGIGNSGSSILNSRSKTPVPCFFDYPRREAEEMSIPIFCTGGQARKDCPADSNCSNGALIACTKEYTEVSREGAKCVLTPVAKTIIKSLTNFLTTSGAATLCDGSSESIDRLVVKLDENTGRHLFWYDRIAALLDIRFDIGFIREANKEPGGPFFVLKNDALIGLTENVPIVMSIACKVKSFPIQCFSENVEMLSMTQLAGLTLLVVIWLCVRK